MGSGGRVVGSEKGVELELKLGFGGIVGGREIESESEGEKEATEGRVGEVDGEFVAEFVVGRVGDDRGWYSPTSAPPDSRHKDPRVSEISASCDRGRRERLTSSVPFRTE